jgi:hypothetical protein
MGEHFSLFAQLHCEKRLLGQLARLGVEQHPFLHYIEMVNNTRVLRHSSEEVRFVFKLRAAMGLH